MSQQLGLVPSSMVKQRSLVSESYEGGKLCQEDDLVLNRLKAHLGVFARAEQEGVISPDYTVLRPLPCADVRYFEAMLRSPACRSELRVRAKGIVEGFWRLYTDDFYDIALPTPPADEQAAIVRFLDYMDRRIRRYIRAKQKVIGVGVGVCPLKQGASAPPFVFPGTRTRGLPASPFAPFAATAAW